MGLMFPSTLKEYRLIVPQKTLIQHSRRALHVFATRPRLRPQYAQRGEHHSVFRDQYVHLTEHFLMVLDGTALLVYPNRHTVALQQGQAVLGNRAERGIRAAAG